MSIASGSKGESSLNTICLISHTTHRVSKVIMDREEMTQTKAGFLYQAQCHRKARNQTDK